VKTCNGGYCSYRGLGGTLPMCHYPGYCDYQCPKDSRGWSSPEKTTTIEFPTPYQNTWVKDEGK